MNQNDLKHGMKVTCKLKGIVIDDAKISIDSEGAIFICQNEKSGSGTNNKLGYDYSWNIYHPRRYTDGTRRTMPFDKQLTKEGIEVTKLKVIKTVDDIIGKKPVKVTAPLAVDPFNTLKTDEEDHTIKPAEDLPVFTSDLDSSSKELLKKKAPRI